MEKLPTEGEWKKKAFLIVKSIGKGALKKSHELNWGEIRRKKKASLYSRKNTKAYAVYSFMWICLNSTIHKFQNKGNL